MLDVVGHQGDLFGVQLARGTPVGHAGRRAVGDQRFQILLAAGLGDVRCQRLAGGTLAQHAVTAGTALEVDLPCLLELGIGQVRRTGGTDNGGVLQHLGRGSTHVGRFRITHLGIGKCAGNRKAHQR